MVLLHFHQNGDPLAFQGADVRSSRDYVTLSEESCLLPEISPCSSCGQTPEIEADRPEGRLRDVYRVVCECGQGSSHKWSVSDFAAIRLWNEIMGIGTSPSND